MKIEARNAELKYPKAIKNDKTKLVLDWLLEFRFSSIDLLAERLGSTSAKLNVFFNRLIQDGLIQVFKNVHTNHGRYVMLTNLGLEYLQVLGRDISKATTRVAHLGRYAQIMHDMAVQYGVLKRLDQFDEVIWDRHIDFPNQFEKPDVILHSPKGYWAALEYERWRKDNKRIYISFVNHAMAITKRLYEGVFFVFDQQSDLNHYQKIFSEAEWPRFKRERKSGVIKPLDSIYKPDEVENLRKCFAFVCEPIMQK